MGDGHPPLARRCATCRHWGAHDLDDAEIPAHLQHYLTADEPYRWCHQDASAEDIARGDATISTALGHCAAWQPGSDDD